MTSDQNPKVSNGILLTLCNVKYRLAWIYKLKDSRILWNIALISLAFITPHLQPPTLSTVSPGFHNHICTTFAKERP